MSTECARAARVSAAPVRRGGAPFAARTAFIARTIAYSPGVTETPATLSEDRGSGGVESAPAVALRASTSPSTVTKTLRSGRFPDIRGVGGAPYKAPRTSALRSSEDFSDL